jgi:hypothetical protein
VSHQADGRHGTLAQAVTDVAELLAGETATSKTFMGGLIAGALVGAAIAGASLVRSRLGLPEGRREPTRPEPPKGR